jgi:hypothetical protein
VVVADPENGPWSIVLHKHATHIGPVRQKVSLVLIVLLVLIDATLHPGQYHRQKLQAAVLGLHHTLQGMASHWARRPMRTAGIAAVVSSLTAKLGVARLPIPDIRENQHPLLAQSR